MPPKSNPKSKSQLKPNHKPQYSKTRKSSDYENKNSNSSQSAIAAIMSLKHEEDFYEFMNYLLELIDDHSTIINDLVAQKSNMKCGIMVADGTNSFSLLEILYDTKTQKCASHINIPLSEESSDSIAIAALMDSQVLKSILSSLKKGAVENSGFKCALSEGMQMGVKFAVLKSTGGKKFKLSESLFEVPRGKNTCLDDEGSGRKKRKSLESEDETENRSPPAKKPRK